MSNKTGTKFVSTGVVIAALVLAAYIFFPFHRAPTRLGQVRIVTVTVTFEPPVRENCPRGNGRVTVSWSAGTQQHPLETICQSGWARTAEVNGGQLVQAWVDQLWGVSVTCTIKQPGFKPWTKTKLGPGRVHCRYAVI